MMIRHLLIYLTALTLTACGGSSGPAPNTPLPTPNPPVAGLTPAEQLSADLEGLSLNQFYAVSIGAIIYRSPENIVWQALTSVYPLAEATLDDISNEYQLDTFAMYQVALDKLLTYDRSALSAAQKIDYDVYQWYLQDKIDQLEFLYYDFRATYSLFGTQRDTETFFTDIHPLNTRQDAVDYITRLTAVNTKFTQLSDHLVLQRINGIIEPALSLEIATNQVRGIAQGGVDNNPYYSNFLTKVATIPGLGAADRQGLSDQARLATINSVAPGYQTLLATLEGLMSVASNSIGVGQYFRGNDYYAHILRHHTTTSLTAAEIHQKGLDEMQRIQNEMRLLFDELGYPQDETIPELFARVEADGGIIPAHEVLPTYETLIADAESKLDQAFNIFPMADVIVAPDDFGGFYIGPSFDGSRPGAFYAGTMTSQPWYQMPSLTYHESVPGHHTQIALAMEQDAPVFRKAIRFTAFVEGWALYAERLAWELGWYENDIYGDLGRLQYEALRAARLVMDTGIHSFGWSFDQAVLYNEQNVGWSTNASQGAAARYSVTPGQATAYMIGMLKILEERQRAIDELGTRFDLRNFHTALLSNGAVPLEVLGAVVDEYISATLSKP